MADDAEQTRGDAASQAERAELHRMIDQLMAAPPKPWPSVIVVGDENVTAIYAPASPDRRPG
ncbi:MAG: hypothetical protein JF588_14755 [Caulobacterales bacterium]|nr:hypothetical protein [Caulobacterales bacterium]